MKITVSSYSRVPRKSEFDDAVELINIAIRAMENVEKPSSIFASNTNYKEAQACADKLYSVGNELATSSDTTYDDDGGIGSWCSQCIVGNQSKTIKMSYMRAVGEKSGGIIVMCAYADRYGRWLDEGAYWYLLMVKDGKDVNVQKRTGNDVYHCKYEPDWKFDASVPKTARIMSAAPASTPTTASTDKHKNTILVMQTATEYSSQVWFYSGNGNALQKDSIKKHWDDGKCITSAAHTARGWFLAMSKYPHWSNQTYNVTSYFPESWIKEKMADGYAVTSITNGDGSWFTVMTKGSKFTKQEFCYAPWSEAKEFISKWWDNDYYITSATYHNGKWVVVMSATSLYSSQSYFTRTDFEEFKAKIKEKWDEGQIITIFETGEGKYLGVMTKRADGKSPGDRWAINLDDVSEHTRKYYAEKFHITYIGR